jgi:hypothetical protein
VKPPLSDSESAGEYRPARPGLLALSFRRVKGIRHFFRNFTALAVKEHLRAQIEDAGSGAELTPKEVELVRFAAERSGQLNELADRSRLDR